VLRGFTVMIEGCCRGTFAAARRCHCECKLITSVRQLPPFTLSLPPPSQDPIRGALTKKCGKFIHIDARYVTDLSVTASVRQSFLQLCDLCSSADKDWVSGLHNSQWFGHVSRVSVWDADSTCADPGQFFFTRARRGSVMGRCFCALLTWLHLQVLSIADKVAVALTRRGAASILLVGDETGDADALVSAISQILLDKYFRTTEGSALGHCRRRRWVFFADSTMHFAELLPGRIAV